MGIIIAVEKRCIVIRKIAEQLVDLTMKMDSSTFDKIFESRDAAIESTLQQLKDKETRMHFYNFCNWVIEDAKNTIQEAEGVQKRLLKLMKIMKDNEDLQC